MSISTFKSWLITEGGPGSGPRPNPFKLTKPLSHKNSVLMKTHTLGSNQKLELFRGKPHDSGTPFHYLMLNGKVVKTFTGHSDDSILQHVEQHFDKSDDNE